VFWLGLTDFKEGVWIWSDGSPFAFNNWSGSGPSNSWGNEDCVQWVNGKWNDINCARTFHFMCKKDISFCPDGWKKFNQNCYKNGEKTLNWQDAENHCKQEGGHLASVNSKEENDFIRTISSGVFWLGLTDFKEGVWIWSDGSPFAFNNWSGSGPSNSGGNEDCVQWVNGKWNDINCARVFHFMCKKDISF